MSGNAAAGRPCSTARAISSPVKYGRSTLSGSGNRQQISQLKHALLGTSWGRILGAGVTSETFFAISAVMRNSAGMPHSSTIPKTLKSLTQSALTGILVAVSLLSFVYDNDGTPPERTTIRSTTVAELATGDHHSHRSRHAQGRLPEPDVSKQIRRHFQPYLS